MQAFILCSICLFVGMLIGAVLQTDRENNYKKCAIYYKAKYEEVNKALLNEIKGGANDEK